MKDPILQELWEIKDRIARQNNNNLDKLAEKLRAKEKSKRPANPAKSKKAARP